MIKRPSGFREIVNIVVVAAVVAILAPAVCSAQQAGNGAPSSADEAELAKKLNNQVSDLVSVPIQLNWEQGVGPNDQTRFILNVQPVMPFSLNADWNMIARVILPLVSQPPLVAGGQPEFGISDVLASFFFHRQKVPSSGVSGPSSVCRRRLSRLSARKSGRPVQHWWC